MEKGCSSMVLAGVLELCSALRVSAVPPQSAILSNHSNISHKCDTDKFTWKCIYFVMVKSSCCQH